jgi:two-component sensor histidine kinase
VGIPAGIDIRTARSFGLQIARTLTRQLDGTISLERNGGTTVRVTFTIEPPENLQAYDSNKVQRFTAARELH